jgi:hypothetical protein
MTTNIFQTEFNLNSNDTYSRRDAISFLAKALGVVSVLPAYKGIERIIGAETLAFAQDKVIIGGLERQIVVPSDEKLLEWMKDPVVDTLKSLKGNVVILDNLNDINQDKNYVREVYQEHISPEKRQPVMSLFYADVKRLLQGNEGASRGNAALIRAINLNYPEIKAIGYNMANADMVPPQRELDLRAKYGLRNVPAVLFYGVNSDKNVEYMGDGWQLRGGITMKDLDFLKQKIHDYYKYIPKNFVK